jgi:DNA modification methylase
MTLARFFRTNMLYCGDNLKLLHDHIPDESIDLIYLDPPFFSNRDYEVIWGDEAEIRSFEDRWDAGLDGYLDWMEKRLVEITSCLEAHGLALSAL